MKKIVINTISILFIILTIMLSTYNSTSAKRVDNRKGLTMCVASDGSGTYYACLENSSTWDCGGTPPCE